MEPNSDETVTRNEQTKTAYEARIKSTRQPMGLGGPGGSASPMHVCGHVCGVVLFQFGRIGPWTNGDEHGIEIRCLGSGHGEGPDNMTGVAWWIHKQQDFGLIYIYIYHTGQNTVGSGVGCDYEWLKSRLHVSGDIPLSAPRPAPSTSSGCGGRNRH